MSRTRHGKRKVILTALLVLLILLVGAGATYLAVLNHSFVTNIVHESLLPPSTPSEAWTGTGPSEVSPSTASPSTGTVSHEGVPARKDLNILLIGSDGKTGVDSGRSDVIILAHVSGDRKKVYLVHFPRDMYVDIPGSGKDKINAAFFRGGSQLLVRTMQQLVGVTIDHVAVVGFEGFEEMTDAVGGVDVYAEEASVDEVYNEDFTEKWTNTIHVGMNHLDGKSALAFVRQRYQLTEGDISRGRRQQAFVKALLLKVLSRETLTNPARFARLVDAATRYLTVDSGFTTNKIYSLALSMRSLRSGDVVFVTAPIASYGTTSTGAWIEHVDYAKLARLSAALKSDRMSTYTAAQ
jgi:LCP family protein required for cell wall assembly